MEALEELKEKTRDSRRSLMATVVLVDASATACNEWVTVVTDYVGPQMNHIAGKFLDHQVRRDGGSLDSLHLPIWTWTFSSESLSSRMDCHRRARVLSFASDTSARLKLSGGIVWRFQSSSGLGKSAMRTQRNMGRRCSMLLLVPSRCARPTRCHLLTPSPPTFSYRCSIY